MSADFSEPQLVIVQAPAGYGKTAVLRDLAARSELPTAWIEIEPGDNDPPVLARALGQALAPICERPPPAPDGDLRSLRMSWAPELSNRLRDFGPRPGLLVIDRLERLTSASANELLSTLLSTLGPELRVMLGSRRKPGLKLARRLASGGVLTIAAADLEFDIAAVRAVFEQAGGAQPRAEDLAAVQHWSCGWRVSIELAAAAWARRQLTGADDRDPAGIDIYELLEEVDAGPLADYVERQVLAELSDQERQLLPALAAIDRASFGLASALADDDDRVVVSLRDGSELVVTLDAAGQWLAVRPALRGPLVALLERSRDGGEAEIRTRAGLWFEQQGMIDEAIEQAAAAGGGEMVARLLREHGLMLVSRRRLDALRVGLDAAAPGAISADLGQALRLIIAAAEGDDVRGLAERAQALSAANQSSDPDVTALASIVLASPGNGVRRATAAATGALARMGPDHILRGYIVSLLGFGLLLNGRPGQARTLLHPVIGIRELAWSRTIAFAVLALIAVDEGDPQLAERYAQAAVELYSEPGGFAAADAALAYAALAEALRLTGQLVRARETLEEARSLVWRGSLRHGLVLVCDAQLALAERRRGVARISAERARELLREFPDPGAWLLARLAAIEAALTQRVDAAQAGSMPSPAELRVLEALFTCGSRSEIARQLFLSEQTVKSHLRRLYRRFGVSSREEALAVARARGLAPATLPDLTLRPEASRVPAASSPLTSGKSGP